MAKTLRKVVGSSEDFTFQAFSPCSVAATSKNRPNGRTWIKSRRRLNCSVKNESPVDILFSLGLGLVWVWATAP